MDSKQVLAYAMVAVSTAAALDEARHLNTVPTQMHGDSAINVGQQPLPTTARNVSESLNDTQEVAFDPEISFASRCTDCDQLRPVFYQRSALVTLLRAGAPLSARCHGCDADWTVEHEVRADLMKQLVALS